MLITLSKQVLFHIWNMNMLVGYNSKWGKLGHNSLSDVHENAESNSKPLTKNAASNEVIDKLKGH